MASKTVDEYPDCERYPNRIFNTGKYIQGGRGSIHGDIVFLFPRFMATGGKYIFNNYSPLVKFKDDNLYHMFKQRFADDVNWVTKNRNNYGIV